MVRTQRPLPQRLRRYFFISFLYLHPQIGDARILDFITDFGGIPNDDRSLACAQNKRSLQTALDELAAATNDEPTVRTLLVPNGTFYLHHGVKASQLIDATILLEGTLRFERLPDDNDESDVLHQYGTERHQRPATDPPCSISIQDSRNVTITSSQRGVIDGQGSQYWGEPIIGYLEPATQRPTLLRFDNVSQLLLENVVVRDSAFHTISLKSATNATIRALSVVNRRTAQDGHSIIDLSAFNTVGLEITGNSSYVQIHDVDIWTQDDCISLRSSSNPPSHISNIVVERVNASGMGVTLTGDGVGSIIDNIHVRDVYLHKSVRGIHVKFLPPRISSNATNSTALISNVVVEDLYMESPTQWPLWLGPAQIVSGSASSEAHFRSSSQEQSPCDGQLCSLCWPTQSGSSCQAVPNTSLVNVTFSNATIHNPHMSPGVLLADPSRGAIMESIVFDHVLVVEIPTWSNKNATPTPPHLHPYARNLSETFPGLAQPIRDEYVPNNSGGSDGGGSNHQQRSDGSSENDDAIALDTSTSWDHWFLASMMSLAAVSALLLVFSPFLWALVVTPSSEGEHLAITDANASSRAEAASTPLSNEYAVASTTVETAPTSPANPKRVRFASDEEVTPTFDDSDHNPDTLSSSLTEPLLNTEQDATIPGSPSLSSSTDTHPTTTHRVANSFRWTHGHWVLALALLTSGGLVTWCVKYYMVHSRSNTRDNVPEWDKTDRYYRCEGVTGIARGGTWPVPSCFNQRPSQWWVLLKHLHGAALWIVVGCTAASLLIASLVLAWRHCKRRDRFRPFHEWRSLE